MRKKGNLVYVPDDAIKEAAQDAFGHKAISDAVLETITNTKPPFTIGIFGGWGTGKSSILELLCEDLSARSIRFVWIDAWKYSSSENLKRSFLLSVTSQLWPTALEDLDRMLYGSIQKREIDPSQLLKPKPTIGSWLRRRGRQLKHASKICLRIMLYLFIFFLVIAALLFLRDLFSENPNGTLTIGLILDTLISYAYIPIVLAIIEALSPLISTNPTVITRERIDADELLSRMFNRVVDKALYMPWRNQLVIIVDNLDRLSDEMIIQALEALKTFLGHDHCVYVVACDDEVVRRVISQQRDPLPPDNSSAADADGTSEEYLDKFFQQTFRVSAYLENDLTDFAIEQFSRTKLAKELARGGISISNIVSTSLPSDIKSPRKVKRLINEFISSYSIATRREGGGPNNLRPGTLTSNPEFLAKFSTIRAEFGGLYRALVNRPALLEEIDTSIRKLDDAKARSLLSPVLPVHQVESCLDYLRKTQVVTTEEIEAHVWFSQDNLSKELPADQARTIRIGLSNNDIESINDVLAKIDSEEERKNILNVMARLVDLSLKGRSQQNGIILLASLIDEADLESAAVISQVAARHIPKWPITQFQASDLMSIAEHMPPVHYQDMMRGIVQILEDPNLVNHALFEVLRSWKTVRKMGGTDRVSEWRGALLDSLQSDKSKSILLRWIFSIIGQFLQDAHVLGEFFFEGFPIVAAKIVLGEIPPEYASTEEPNEKEEATSFLRNLGSYELASQEPDFIEAINLLLNSDQLQALSLGLELAGQLSENLTSSSAHSLVHPLTKAIGKMGEVYTGDDAPELIRNYLHLLGTVCEVADEVDADLTEEVRYSLSQLGENPRFANLTREFYGEARANGYSNLLVPFDLAMADLFEASSGHPDESSVWLETLVRHAASIDKRAIRIVAEKINSLMLSIDEHGTTLGSSHLMQVIVVEEFSLQLSPYFMSWIEDLSDLSPNVVGIRLQACLKLNGLRLLPTADAVASITTQLPLEGNQETLGHILEFLEEILDDIPDDTGENLAHKVFEDPGPYTSQLPRYFALILKWIDSFDEDRIEDAVQIYIDHFSNNAARLLPHMSSLINRATLTSQIKLITSSYEIDLAAEEDKTRDSVVRDYLSSIKNGDQQVEIVSSIWSDLTGSGLWVGKFAAIVLDVLERHLIDSLRRNAIREAGTTNDLVEVNHHLLFLENTAYSGFSEVMRIVNIFRRTFSKDEQWVRMSNERVYGCFRRLKMESTHKHRLAKSMGNAAKRFGGDLPGLIRAEAQRLRILGDTYFSRAYRKHWQ